MLLAHPVPFATMWVPLARPSRRTIVAAAAVAGVAVIALGVLGGFFTHVGGLYGDVMDKVLAQAPLLIGALIFWPVLLAIAARPQVGVLIIAALVPYDGLLVIVHTPPFTEGYKEGLTIFTLLWAVLTVAKNRRPKEKLPRYVAPVCFYMAVGFASAARVGGIDALVGVKTSFFYLLIPVALWLCPLSPKERDRLVSILMLNGFVTALFGLYQQAIGESGLLKMGYEYETSIRTTGSFLRSFSTFVQPFNFGLFLMMVLLVGTAVSLEDTRRLRNRLFLATTPVLMAALAFTFVRSAWMGLALGAFYLAFHRYRVLLFFAPFVLPLVILLPASFEQGAFYKGSLQERQSGWAQNLNKAADPFGNGIGTTGSAAEKALKVQARRENFYQPDNNYFKVLYELGVLGLFFFAMMLIASFLYTRDVEEQVRGPDLALAIGAGANILGVIVAAFTSVYFEIFPNELYFWLLLGMVASCLRDPESSTTPSR